MRPVTRAPRAPFANRRIFTGAAHALVVSFGWGGRTGVEGWLPQASGHGRGGSGVLCPPGTWKRGRQPRGELAPYSKVEERGWALPGSAARLGEAAHDRSPSNLRAYWNLWREAHWAISSSLSPRRCYWTTPLAPPTQPGSCRGVGGKLKLTQYETSILSGNCSLRCVGRLLGFLLLVSSFNCH